MPKGTPGKVIIVCPSCNERKEHYAKGQCRSCYWERYYQERREEKIQAQREWRARNGEQHKAYNRHWRRENPEKKVANEAQRRARKRSVADTLTFEQLEFERRIGEVTYFGERLHLHHIVPLSKGGGHTWGNVVFIPVSLNTSIRDKLPEEVYMQAELGI